MKKNFQKIIFILFIFNSAFLQAQRHRCGSAERLQQHILANPALQQIRSRNEIATKQWLANKGNFRGNTGVTTIPVVVHIIYNIAAQNISDQQVLSQIAVLNKDFRKLNSDSLHPQHPFYKYTADAKVEFCLAQKDPNGKPTSGITRTSTNIKKWDSNNEDDIKSTANGGHDNWDPTKYLNIWVGNLTGNYVGFSTFPDELVTAPELDGVVIAFESFGTMGAAGSGLGAGNVLGRTGTHEIGHWLNLSHIWGDAKCGDDSVADTEPAESENYDCPSFPHRANNACGTGPNGEMYMNFMDYADDSCLNMYTKGQAGRMQATLNTMRQALLTSNACSQNNIIENLDLRFLINVFPNPNNGKFTVSIDGDEKSMTTIYIYDLLGNIIKGPILFLKNQSTKEISELACGVYMLKIQNGSNFCTKKIVVTN